MAIYRPTASAAVNTALIDPGYAYDNNSTTAATSGNVTGTETKGQDYYGFTSYANPSTVVLTVDWSATTTMVFHPYDEGITAYGVAHLQYSVNGGTSWTTLEQVFGGNTRSRQATQYPLSGVTQLSSLRIRCQASGARIAYYDEVVGRTRYRNASASITVYEISVDVASHSVNLSHTAPGTGAGKMLYASNLWNASAGTYGTPSASTPATFTQDGSSGFWFLDSYY